MRLNNLTKLFIAVGVSELAGILGSVFTISAIPTWYETLTKPALNPPAWVFGPAWTTLYALMGIALFLVWKQHSNILQNVRMLWMWKMAIAVFFIQLFLNAIWSIIFFGLHGSTWLTINNLGWAFVDIVALWFAIVWTIVVFYKIFHSAAYLLVPYILWVSFAAYLNFSIWQANKTPDTVFCTQDAKLCSDGSYVGRTGPNCEFALCPKEDLIKVENVKANDTVSSPLTVKGQARGIWFFEASFPIVLTDWDGRIISEGYAMAKKDWMTEDFVPFEGVIEFKKPEYIGDFSRRGALILRKDNPSGLPEYDDAIEIPILFEN
ncbi:MAG: tryptophan-rich sensory protein [Candidatus Yanofskybacteria bacterium]|nr:tryptophan-rich sensory protein [Candidatus Yanofskybacteria bacterium]